MGQHITVSAPSVIGDVAVFDTDRSLSGQDGIGFSSADRRTLKTNQKIIASAEAQTTYTNIYDPAYRVMRYPNGDLPRERGVCTDVIVRALREGAGIDLQKEIHEDMLRNFRAYPQRYGLRRPDANIDHRRVPNLMTYFRRQGKAVAVSTATKDYRPGDIVAWDLGGGVLHIGIVSDTWSNANNRYEIIHNIGAGARKEDRLFDWRVIAHYRY